MDKQTREPANRQGNQLIRKVASLGKLKSFIVMFFLCKVHLISIQDSFSEIGRLVVLDFQNTPMPN